VVSNLACRPAAAAMSSHVEVIKGPAVEGNSWVANFYGNHLYLYVDIRT
jgi:hypothetical protein